MINRTCSACNKTLNKYSPGNLCGSCAWEARARVGEPPSLPSDFWADQPMRAALAKRELQAVLRIYLECTGLTQEAVALLVDTDQSTVSKIVRGHRSRYTIEDIESFRDGLHIPGHLLGLQPGRHKLSAEVTFEAGSVSERGDDPTKRRDFNKTALLTALGVSGMAGEALASTDPTRHIGMEHVRMLQRAVDRLRDQDSLVGGDTLYNVATSLYNRAYQWLQGSSYPTEVGEALHEVTGHLGASVGWLAIDSQQQAKARQHLQQTLLLARMADDRPLEVRVLSLMSLQSVQRHPREAFQMAKTAQRVAGGWGTPRVHALLHLRAARAYAAMGNESGFQRELAKTKNEFEHGTHADDPSFFNFVTTGEVAALTALAYLDLNKPERASELLYPIVEAPESAFRRNVSLRTITLADARLRSGDISQAAEIGLGAVQIASAMDSARVRRRLRDLRNHTVPHMRAVPKAREFVASYDAAFGVKASHA
ncbi:hypothetical protein ACQP1W_01215 [Spirillospora sp. CA-255316]